MASQDLYYAGQNALWLQYDCGDPTIFLGCHNLTGVSAPRGDTNPTYCRVGKGEFEVKRTWRGTPGLGSANIVAYDTILNYVQELPCPFNLYVMYSACGSDEDFTNYDYLYIYNGMEPTSEDTDTQVVGMSQDDETPVMLSLPVTFKKRLKVKKLVAESFDVSAVTTADILGVSMCDEAECGGICGAYSIGCQEGFFVTAGGGAAAVIGDISGGGSSFATVASPFTTATDDIHAVACDGDLVIVLNGTSTSYAYSHDGGTTFTEVTGLAALPNRATIVGGYKIWMVGQSGYVWYSNDRGASMTVQDAGVATAQSLNDVAAASALLVYAVGDNNAFIRTTDGGETWAAVTGPAASIFPNDLYRVTAIPGTEIVLVGDEQGNVYRSEDAGATWSPILTDYANLAGGIYGIAAPDCNVLAVVGNSSDPYFYGSAVGYFYQSIDGGSSWMNVELPTNTGVRDLWACSVNTYWTVGDGGFLAKVAGPTV